jgi:deoxyribonuclease-4
MSKDRFSELSKFMELSGYNCAQIFTKSPMSVTNIDTSNDNNIKSYLRQNDILLFVHGQYIINGCKVVKDNLWGVNSIIDDIMWLDNISHIPSGVVLHLGKNCKKYNLSKEQAESQMLETIIYILEKITHKSNSTQLLLETSSGQGSEICCDLNDFKKLIQQIPTKYHNHIGICIDTAHLWGSGYDLNDNSVVDFVFDTLSPFIKLVHLNDSLVPLNSKKDRHAPLYSGTIFTSATSLDYLLYKIKTLNIPIILETKGDYQQEISILREKI